ncbi:unnamed protein product [Rotaria sp. Silwood1]|nr:unnamed protein product [Rotaria sp. Silwood1]CAF4852909.1 unnamed protein product [Rotaria sp. Silwood1]
MEKQTTIKDIALALQISTSTVSRALRNASDVKPETKSAVLALAEELNYQPNQLALSLLKKQTHTIGVIVPNLDYVLATMVKGIDEVALEAGYTVMVCQSNESYGRELLNVSRLNASLVDGFIISVSSETKMITNEIKAPKIILDNEDGGYQATQHLIEQGYTRIAILAGQKNLGISNQRMDGYIKALKANKIRVDNDLIIHCDFNQDYAYLATKELLNMRKRPDAIFTISDRMAVGAMLAIKEKGLQMPNDIGLVGFNNEPVTALVTPTISSIEQPAFEMAIIKVATAKDLQQANEKAKAGDTIILQNGSWNDIVIKLTCTGTEQQPILFKAATAGKVKITGKSSLKIGGSFIVVDDGFKFENNKVSNFMKQKLPNGFIKELPQECVIRREALSEIDALDSNKIIKEFKEKITRKLDIDTNEFELINSTDILYKRIVEEKDKYGVPWQEEKKPVFKPITIQCTNTQQLLKAINDSINLSKKINIILSGNSYEITEPIKIYNQAMHL